MSHGHQFIPFVFAGANVMVDASYRAAYHEACARLYRLKCQLAAAEGGIIQAQGAPAADRPVNPDLRLTADSRQFDFFLAWRFEMAIPD
jgi:hypothetical protein